MFDMDFYLSLFGWTKHTKKLVLNLELFPLELLINNSLSELELRMTQQKRYLKK